MGLEKLVEAILFYKGEPVLVADLVKATGHSNEEVRTALSVLQSSLTERGLRLVLTENDATLVTAPEFSETIESMRKEEMKRDIGKAGAETLSIILYRGLVSRTDIDYVRGVNSSFILRNLLMRGLIVREQNKKDARTFVYSASPELLQNLGVTKRENLPDYEAILARIDSYEQEREVKEQSETVEQETA